MKLSKKWLIDTAERVVGTFLEAFVATLVVSASGVSLTAVKTAALAGLASALTLVKSLVGAYVGNPDSASVIPSVGAAQPQTQTWPIGQAVSGPSIPPDTYITSFTLNHAIASGDGLHTSEPTPEEVNQRLAAEETARRMDAYREPTWKVPIGSAPAPPHPGAIPADRVTPLHPPRQQS